MKIEISLKENYILINYNGFKNKTTDTSYLKSLLSKDYGEIKSKVKRGNDLFINYSRATIVIKSIRNVEKFAFGYLLVDYINSLKPNSSLKRAKSLLL